MRLIPVAGLAVLGSPGIGPARSASVELPLAQACVRSVCPAARLTVFAKAGPRAPRHSIATCCATEAKLVTAKIGEPSDESATPRKVCESAGPGSANFSSMKFGCWESTKVSEMHGSGPVPNPRGCDLQLCHSDRNRSVSDIDDVRFSC